MKTWPLPALALATAPLFAAYADWQEAPPHVGKDPFALPDTQAPPPPAGARPSDEAIRKAVREVMADYPDKPFTASDGTALSGGPYKEFSRQFSEAKKPHCMGPDPLKHQPHSIETKSWVIGASGIFALPFWAAAIVRGKCNWTR
ncbi:hypothetical protein [uncultured Massilia sp.]|uniref:hypothetical protein n=1 Tax=uncultured Massilia sp. TaxID=169973 RepID=UPI00258DC061|nr:hypothetical protein [uncultured Massilia sp.]